MKTKYRAPRVLLSLGTLFLFAMTPCFAQADQVEVRLVRDQTFPGGFSSGIQRFVVEDADGRTDTVTITDSQGVPRRDSCWLSTGNTKCNLNPPARRATRINGKAPFKVTIFPLPNSIKPFRFVKACSSSASSVSDLVVTEEECSFTLGSGLSVVEIDIQIQFRELTLPTMNGIAAYIPEGVPVRPTGGNSCGGIVFPPNSYIHELLNHPSGVVTLNNANQTLRFSQSGILNGSSAFIGLLRKRDIFDSTGTNIGVEIGITNSTVNDSALAQKVCNSAGFNKVQSAIVKSSAFDSPGDNRHWYLVNPNKFGKTPASNPGNGLLTNTTFFDIVCSEPYSVICQ